MDGNETPVEGDIKYAWTIFNRPVLLMFHNSQWMPFDPVHVSINGVWLSFPTYDSVYYKKHGTLPDHYTDEAVYKLLGSIMNDDTLQCVCLIKDDPNSARMFFKNPDGEYAVFNARSMTGESQ